MLLPLYGMEAYISCLSGGANPAEITEYHVLSGLFLAADITAQQGEVLAINRCPYFHFGREKYLWGTDLHEVGHDPMYGGHFAQVDNGIQIIGAEALPSSVHVAFAAAKSVEETGVTAASATAITMDEVMDLYYSLRAVSNMESFTANGFLYNLEDTVGSEPSVV